jgi:pilus assembly protein CpaF
MVLMGEVNLSLASVRSQLQSAIDLVVQVARRPDGARRVMAVAEVVPGAVGDGDESVRLLAGSEGVVALPARPARVPWAPAPDPVWLAE